MASSKYHRQARVRHLIKALEEIKNAKIHLGAGETEDFQLNFQEVFNSPEKKDEYGRRTRAGVRRRGFNELEAAKEEFRSACLNCELRTCCCGYTSSNPKAAKESRERIFMQLFDVPTARTRFRRRIRQDDIATGLVTAFCSTLIRPGRLKPDTDFIR